MASEPIPQVLIDFFLPELESRISDWERTGRNPIINRLDYGVPGTPRPRLRSVMAGFSPTDLIEVMTPSRAEPVRLWDEGFGWDEWGSYENTQHQAEVIGGIPFTIHDGDDGDRDYLRIPMGRVNRFGAHIMTKESYDRLLAWSRLGEPFNEYEDGQVIMSQTYGDQTVRVGRHDVVPMTVQGGELVHDY